MPKSTYMIPSTPADGNTKVVVMVAMAGDEPTLAELNAQTTVDISCYLTADGYSFSQEQATISDERLCSTETFGLPGRKTVTLSLTGIDNTNSPLEKDYNAMAEVLAEGAQRYLVSRPGLPFDSAFAVDQKVRVTPFLVGAKSEMAPEANSVQRATWAAFPNGPSRLVTVKA